MNGIIRALIFSVFVTGGIGLPTGVLHAQNPPWCAVMDNDGNTDCSYYTERECLQTVSGVGGVCIHNPAGGAPQMTAPSSENAQGLLQLQQQDPGPPPGLDGSANQGPPNN